MINCPHCSHPETRVTEIKELDGVILRYRECRQCKEVFPTHEVPVPFAK